jgi:hypothetical protein
MPTEAGPNLPEVTPGLHVEWVDEEAVVLDTSTGDLHYLNTSAAVVFASILEYGYERAIKELDHAHGDSPKVKRDVQDVIEDMIEKGLLRRVS